MRRSDAAIATGRSSRWRSSGWTMNGPATSTRTGVRTASIRPLPIICLNHNPANCDELMKYPWQWMLAGHTHGRQVATSKIGRTLYPHRYRHYTHGYYTVKGRHLYVNRGLSLRPARAGLVPAGDHGVQAHTRLVAAQWPIRMNPTLLLQVASRCIETGQHAQAEATCREILRDRPNDHQALDMLGQALQQLSRGGDAVVAHRAL